VHLVALVQPPLGEPELAYHDDLAPQCPYRRVAGQGPRAEAGTVDDHVGVDGKRCQVTVFDGYAVGGEARGEPGEVAWGVHHGYQ
jgi:hypothetical protein